VLEAGLAGFTDGTVLVDDFSDDAGLAAYVRSVVAGWYHPVGTCRMGPADRDGTVVADDLSVHGVAGLSVADADVDRFAALYRRDSSKNLVLSDDPRSSEYREHPTFLSGGGGLVSTAADYLRFGHMLAGGGEVDGVRVLSRTTVELMRTNHLPGGGDLRSVALPGGYGEVGFDGMGFGLTVAVSKGPAATQSAGSAGEFMWGGLASTAFWIDPVEEVVAVFMTQLIPSGTFNFRGQLKSIVYGALAD
jgi:CubicO group peptidase (beta-lactamase class C family)